MKQIPLTRGKVSLVDDADFEYLNQWKWSYLQNKWGGYGVRGIRSRKEGWQRMIYMHRQIMNAPDGMEIDHENGNSLDNRRENLRIVTRSQNAQNMSIHKDNASGFKGVYLDKRKKLKPWVARIHVDGEQKHLGMFRTSLEAAYVYNEAAKKYFGEFAKLNVIE